MLIAGPVLLLVIGLGAGWLTGIGIAQGTGAILTGTIAIISGTLAAAPSLISGLEERVRGEKIDQRSERRLAALAALTVGLAIGATIGNVARNQQLLAGHSKLKTKWERLGVKEDIARRLFDRAHPEPVTLTPPSVPPPQPTATSPSTSNPAR